MKTFTSAIAAAAIALGAASALPAAASAAAAAPTATTQAASSVTSSSAVADATINPGGSATTYRFEYGPTASYGAETATASAGSGSTTVSVHTAISGLASNTTYHFRVVAVNSAGTATGQDMTVTTSKLPPNVTLSSPSVIGDDSASIGGSVSPNGKATTYAVQYGPTTQYGFQTATGNAGAGTQPISIHETLSSLTAGTTYHYRLIATNADGTTASADATFETTGNRVNAAGPLPVVSEGGSAAVTDHSVQLNGAINPEGPLTNWHFEVGLTSDYGLQTPTQTLSGLGARPVNARLSGLQSGSTYHYRLVAYSANGLYVGPDHTFTTRGAQRESGTLSVHMHTGRSRGVVSIAVTGVLRLPSGLRSNVACNGPVSVVVRQSGHTVALRHTRVRSNCSYSLTLHTSASRVRRSRLTVSVYYWGNAQLLPRTVRRAARV